MAESAELMKARKEFDRARRRVQEIEDSDFRAGLTKMKSLIGTCLKYRNCYSCPKGPEDYWFVYRRIVGLKGREWVFHEFSIDCLGELRMHQTERASIFPGHELPSGWVVITEAEYEKARKRILAYVAKVT